MNGFSIFFLYQQMTTQIYALWREAVINNSAPAKDKIEEMLRRNIKRLLTKDYPVQAYRARVVWPTNYSDLVIKRESNIDFETLFSGDSGLYGFSANKMWGPPIEKIKGQRANRAKTICLYLASDVETACAEVQPCCEDLISVMEFCLDSSMTLLDLRRLPEDLCSYNSDESIEKLNDIIFCQSLLDIFSMPVHQRDGEKNDSKKDGDTKIYSIYEYSQYISEYFLNKHIDGILYSSSHNYNNVSYNIVLFTPDRATAVGEYGELFCCLSTKTTFQNISKRYRRKEDVTIIEAKREKDPILWNEVLIRRKELESGNEQSGA